MSEQSKALQLAEWLERKGSILGASEVRRLHEERDALLEALKLALAALDADADKAPVKPEEARAAQAWLRGKFGDAARAAIAKAEGGA